MDDDIDARDDTKRKSRNLSEKKRRDQFNMLVNELGSMVNSNTRKMDKSTVLKSTILFLKNHNEIAVRSRAHEIQEDWKPSFLTNEEFIRLILEALDGFIMVFSSNGRIHYASESVTSLLGYLPSELANATIYEIAYQEDQSHLYNVLLNPTTGRKDQQHRIGKKRNSEQRVRRGSKVYTIMAKRRREVASETEKEELADEESAEAGDYIIKEDADSEDGEPNVIETNEIDCNEKQLPVNSSTVSNENQVSFTCHIKRGGLDFREEPIYELVQFIGYFRSDVDADVEGLIPNNKLGSTTSGTDNRKMVFVGTGRLQTPQIIREMSVVDSNKSEFTSRHSLEWKFLFLDHRAPPIIGYLPFEVLGTSGYDYYHVDDLDKVVTCHESLMQKGEGTSCHYRFLTKGQQWIWLQTRFYITYNQWNSKPEFIVCTHRVVSYVDVVKELRKNSETLSKSQSQETTSPSIGEQPQVGASSQMPTSTWSSKSQTQETTSPSTGEHQQVGISSQMPTSTWSSKSSSKASRFVTSFSSRMRHHGGSDTGSISVSSQSSRKSLPVLPSVRHNDSHNECMSPGNAISHKSASAHERTRNPMEPLQPRRQEHQHQQHQQQQQQQQHHQQPQQEYRQVEMSHETSTTFTEPNQYAGEVSIPSAVSASGYSTPNQSMIPTLLTTEMLHQQGIIMTPAQNHIQDELQRKHEELQQLIVHQQEELRRVSEQLLIARYGILSPLLNVGIPAYNSTNPCQQPNPCNNGTTGMRNQIQGMGVGVGMTSTPTTTSAVQEVSILPVPITLPIVPTELFPQSMSPMSANVTGNVVGRTTLEPSSQSPVHQQRQPPPTHQENNNELINFPMCPHQNEIVYTNVPQQQIPTSQHQRPTRN